MVNSLWKNTSLQGRGKIFILRLAMMLWDIQLLLLHLRGNRDRSKLEHMETMDIEWRIHIDANVCI